MRLFLYKWRTVSPVQVHSPVRYIPAPRIGRARVGIEPAKVGQARCSRAPVSLHGPVYPEPTLLVYREEPRRRPEPEPVLEVSEAETVKELMGKLEEREMRELL